VSMKNQSLLTKLEASEEMGGVSLSFVNQLIARKKLPVVKLGYKTVRIRRTDIEDFLQKHTLAGK
jgi:excisionase family DNA binding protein